MKNKRPKEKILPEIRTPTPGRASFFPGLRGKPIVPRTHIIRNNKIIQQRKGFERKHHQAHKELVEA